MRTTRAAQFFACLLLVSAYASLLFAQGGATGTILGTVTDQSGAVVPNATVQIMNVGTAITQQVRTTGSGDYSAPLPPGTYRVTVEAPGFQKAVVDNIGLTVAQQARVNVTVRPGQVTEVVEVNSSAAALDTDSSAVTQLVSSKQVEELPLNGRNFLSLLFIGAGAVQTTGEQGQMRQGEGNAISINGSRPTSNNYTLDGMVNTDTALNTPAVILSQDAIQEFKVQSETYSAEYGFSANQINIVSKSGTNTFHGTAFEFLRNDAFDARNPLVPPTAQAPKLRQNQFGFVLGGPVLIPKVYDGRNKTFFLANYEGWRIRNGTNGFFNVPDPAQLQGNFSGANLPAFSTTPGSPCRTALNSGNPCMPINPLTGQPFPGNIVPINSNLAKVEAKLFPAPNCPGCQGNYRLNTTLANNVDQQTYKLDQVLGKFGSVAFRWTSAEYTNQNINGSVSIPFGLGVFDEQSKSWAISHTISLGPNRLNTFRFGHLDPQAIQGGVPASQADVTALAISGSFQNLPDYARLYPHITLQGLSGGAGAQVNSTTTSEVPVWDYSDTFTLNHGKHTWAMGIDFRNWVQKRNLSADFLGNWNFNNDTVLNNSGGCTTASGLCGTGNATADFLLGYYNAVSTFQPGPFSESGVAGNLNKYHFRYIAPFFQDDWKATSRLTLNLGIRWDYRAVPYEESDKMFWFDRGNPGGGLCFAKQDLLNGVAPSGNGFYRYCGRRNPDDGSKTPFAPRLGFAWRPIGDKTVIRGGYGIFFDSAETREIDDSGDIYPFVVRSSFNPLATPTLPKLSNSMYTPVTLHNVSPAVDGSQFFAVIISEFPKNPYVQQWSLSVQRELARNTTLEANYVGNKGTHLLNRINIGQGLPPANPAFCQANPTQGDCPFLARRPFANITSTLGFLDSMWNGYSNYNAANVKLERRSSSMAAVVVYTWSKSLDDKSAAAGVGATNAFSGHMNEHNVRADYGRSEFDVGQRFVASYVVQLPFGRGKRYMADANKAVDLALGGWELSGITTFQGGFPFSVTGNDSFGLLRAFTQRANLVPGCDVNAGGKSLTHWFNTACFTQPLAGQFGNSGRNIFRGPGINNWDLGLDKTFKFTERVGFQFRVEAFNTFNHPQYGFDPTTSTGITSPVDNNVNDQGASANKNFGKVVAARPGRILQFGGKISF